MSKKARSRKLAQRLRQLEMLERREVMTSNFSPEITSLLGTMLFTGPAAYEAAGIQLSSRFGAGGGGSGTGGSFGGGEAGAPFNGTEAEPNNFVATANFLPLGNAAGKNPVVNISGQMQSFSDEDYFAFDLKKGDIFDSRLTVPVGSANPGAILYTASGTELVFSRGRMLAGSQGALATRSPRFNDGNTTLSYVIDTDGRYFFRVGDASGPYTLNLRTYRSNFEQEAIGTGQVLYLDFNGALLRNDTINLAPASAGTTFRADGIQNYATQLGVTQAQIPGIIDRITANVEAKLKTQLANDTNNGLYPRSGSPGDFNITVVSSNNSPDIWGQPNVSRVVVGGTSATVPGAFAGLLGIAQRVDIGNFDHEDTALVMLDTLITDATNLDITDAAYIPRAGNVSNIDLFVELTSVVIAHEAGHFLGGIHQDPNNQVLSIMDQFYDGVVTSGSGADGIFGTADDRTLRFVNDEYAPTGGVVFGGGVNNAGQHLAFGMSTGTVGSSITGIIYNDLNRNARQDTSTEVGIAGWEVFADLNNNGARENGEPRAVSESNGRFNLRVAPGTYNVRVVRPTSWIPSANSELVKSVTVAAGSTVTVNFGSVVPSNIATGFKWNDLNGDGIQDTGEPTLAGVYIYLDLDGDDRPDLGEPSSLTGADGSYNLTPPSAGTYAIREVVEPGFVQTYPGELASFEHIVTFDGVNPLRGFNFGNFESSDWGDAPAPYPTTRAANGAYHGKSPKLLLGANWDSEQDGRPSAGATGDDTTGTLGVNGQVVDDEDGVTVLAPIVRGDRSNLIQVSITNTDGAVAYLQGWIDFNGNGVWESSEQIATDIPATNGPNNIAFTTPSNAASNTFARFRLSQDKGLGPTGRSTTGEVEDYAFTIVDGPRTLLQPDTFSVDRNSLPVALNLLTNDFQIPNDPWRITSVSSSSSGVRPTIDPTGQFALYTPPRGFVGRDTFTYTATSASGRRETAEVTINVLLRFDNPIAVDDSFDIPTNSTGFPLSVLANDVEGRGGSLVVSQVTRPDKGGAVTIGSGGQSIRYTPPRGFGGTETFTYTATDATGKTSTANITVHTLQNDRVDDDVEFSFEFRNLAGDRITEIRQGEAFQVVVFVDDLRPEKGAQETPPRVITSPGVYSAYLDVLYSSGLVTPNGANGNGLDFDVNFLEPYRSGTTGSAGVPGLIDELGAFIGNQTSFNRPFAVPFATMNFTATAAGIAEFVGDPSDDLPNSEVTFYNTPTTRVAVEQIRFGRASLEIVPNGVNFPFAVDDSRFNLVATNVYNIDVLTNDITGTQPPIRISTLTQPSNGQVNINNNNTPNNFADDTITYSSNNNFAGVDQFTYTITDERGFKSTATVTLHVGVATSDDVIQLRLSATDLSGVPIDQIAVGQKFQLRGYVEDLRTVATRFGVFAGFQDILYSSQFVSVDSSTDPADTLGFKVEFADAYKNSQSGDIRIPGLINELGSQQTDTANPTGRGEKLQFIVTLTARAAGTANFLGDPADIKPFHDSLVFDPTTPLAPNQIRYLTDSIIVTAGTGGGGGGGGEGNTNLTNPYDVNNDGFISPIDVLILVNSMNSGSAGALTSGGGNSANGESGSTRYYVDVNGDNFLSPLDALMVINQLNNRSTGSGEGEGSSIAAPTDLDDDSESTLFEVVEVPFLIKPLSRGFDFSVYGPVPMVEDSEEFESLADYLSSHSSDSDDMDYLDGIASDVLRNS